MTELCGHVNKHYYGIEGKLEDLSCGLPKDHQGDHWADCEKKVPEHIVDGKGHLLKVEYHVEPSEASWSDAAGKPVREIREEGTVQMSAGQKDLVMQILARDPSMEVNMAVAQAKMSKEWNAVGV